jgi:hypothetical protein
VTVGEPAPTLARLTDGLAPERAAAFRHARELVNSALPDHYVEGIAGKMIAWTIPLELYPRTYNGQPLQLAALAAQKNYNALYLIGLYMSDERLARFRDAYAAAGIKLDMGKSCVRFRTATELCDAAITEAIAAVPVDCYIAEYEAVRGRGR